MDVKTVAILVNSKYLIVKAPAMNNKDDYEIWFKVKNTIAKEMVRNRKIYAVAVSPSDEYEFFENTGVPCQKCSSPLSDCCILSPDSWDEIVLEEIVSSMSFELAQLWLFKPPADATNVVNVALKCSGPEDFPETDVETLGCIADDKEVIWMNYGAEANAQAVKKSLEDVIQQNNFKWRVEMNTKTNIMSNLRIPPATVLA